MMTPESWLIDLGVPAGAAAVGGAVVLFLYRNSGKMFNSLRVMASGDESSYVKAAPELFKSLIASIETYRRELDKYDGKMEAMRRNHDERMDRLQGALDTTNEKLARCEDQHAECRDQIARMLTQMGRK